MDIQTEQRILLSFTTLKPKMDFVILIGAETNNRFKELRDKHHLKSSTFQPQVIHSIVYGGIDYETKTFPNVACEWMHPARPLALNNKQVLFAIMDKNIQYKMSSEAWKILEDALVDTCSLAGFVVPNLFLEGI